MTNKASPSVTCSFVSLQRLSAPAMTTPGEAKDGFADGPGDDEAAADDDNAGCIKYTAEETVRIDAVEAGAT